MRSLSLPAPDVMAARRPAFYMMLGWLIWLPLMVPMIASLLASHPAPARLILSLLGAAVFLAVYVWTAWQNGRKLSGPAPSAASSTSLSLWWPVLVMLALSLTLTEVNGLAWGGLFIFTCANAGGRLPARQALILLGAVVLSFFFYGWRRHLGVSESVSNVLFLVLATVATITMVWAMKTSRELRAEREELIRVAAVAEERLRIARDLHDLLGHNLSLIALKSELAGRLMTVAPERAAAEIGDIESVARTALHEVRDAVAGYRQPSLAAELAGAREMLAAASITYRLLGDEGVARPFGPALDAALAWGVREAVTNVIRHSRAHECTIALAPQPSAVRLDIINDGSAIPADALASLTSEGSGLRGLRERVEALGGRCEAGPQPGGRFRVAISIPSDATQDAAPVPEPADAALASTHPVSQPVEEEKA